MYSAWESANPILFGCGTSKLTGQKLKALGVTKALVTYDMGVKNCGIVDPILATLDEAGVAYVCYDNVQPDPPDWSCNEAAALAAENGCDGVLGIGGGSAMDTGKGAALVMGLGGVVNDHFLKMGAPPVDQSKLPPIVVIPTTAGTGSEASPGGVITDTQINKKFPTSVNVSLGIVDPELTLGVPASITANTGIDAYTHAEEAYLSSMPNAIAGVLSLKSCELVAKYLPVLMTEPQNIEARSALSMAATMGTASMRGPFGGYPHTFGGAISKHWHTAHGITVGVFTASVMKATAQVIPDRVAELAKAMGLEVPDGATPDEIGQIIFDGFNKLLDDVNFPTLKEACKGASLDEILEHLEDFYAFNPFSAWQPGPKDDREACLAGTAEIIKETYECRQ